jgi:predicted lipase
MQILYGNAEELHTFGCPRVGDQNFAQYLSQKVGKIRRIVHNKDIVPHVPLISQNFMHPAYEIWFDGNMA